MLILWYYSQDESTLIQQFLVPADPGTLRYWALEARSGLEGLPGSRNTSAARESGHVLAQTVHIQCFHKFL